MMVGHGRSCVKSRPCVSASHRSISEGLAVPFMGETGNVTPLISLHNVTKRFGSVTALKDVSLEITPGVTALLGPNGSGKSTLIKALLGLLKLNRGSGHVLGHTLGINARRIRADVGYMPEDDCYIAGLSGIDMVCFSGRLAGLPGVESMRRSHEILDFCGIDQERYRDVETYSTGMRQKLKFAQAIVHDPQLLILDEPTSSLDPEEREAMLSRIRILSSQFGKSVLISTHILPDVRAVADAIVIIARGQVSLQTSLAELTEKRIRQYAVRLDGPVDGFVSTLAADGHQAEVTPEGTVLIAISEEGQLQPLWAAARTAGVTIYSLQPTADSLETVFLHAVGDATNASA